MRSQKPPNVSCNPPSSSGYWVWDLIRGVQLYTTFWSLNTYIQKMKWSIYIGFCFPPSTQEKLKSRRQSNSHRRASSLYWHCILSSCNNRTSSTKSINPTTADSPLLRNIKLVQISVICLHKYHIIRLLASYCYTIHPLVYYIIIIQYAEYARWLRRRNFKS